MTVLSTGEPSDLRHEEGSESGGKSEYNSMNSPGNHLHQLTSQPSVHSKGKGSQISGTMT